jgi:uncharacterized membrane protein YjjB (DUF3815 family)
MFLLVMWYRPGWAVFAAISSAVLLDCLEVGTDGLNLGVNVYVDDLACLALLLTGVLLLIRYRKGVRKGIPPDAVPCVILLTLLVLSLSRGVSIFGLKQAGNGVRSLFAFTVPALAIMLLRPVLRLDAGRLARWLGWAGSCFCAIALLRWVGALPTPVSLQSDLREVARTLNADPALVVGQAFIASIYLVIKERRRGWWWWAAAGMFGVVTLTLQHRSVWVATAAGAVWLTFRTGRLSPVRWLALGATAMVAFFFIMITDSAIMESVREIVGSDVSEMRSEHSTWAWRVQGYTEATDRVFASGAVDLLLGPPAGWSANSEGSSASIHIHGRYVETLAYNGFVGASVLLVWFVVLIQRVRRRAHTPSKMQLLSRSSRALLQAILISELVYFIPYGGGILQSAVLGLVGIAASQWVFQQRGRRLVLVHARALCTADSAVLASQQ